MRTRPQGAPSEPALRVPWSPARSQGTLANPPLGYPDANPPSGRPIRTHPKGTLDPSPVPGCLGIFSENRKSKRTAVCFYLWQASCPWAFTGNHARPNLARMPCSLTIMSSCHCAHDFHRGPAVEKHREKNKRHNLSASIIFWHLMPPTPGQLSSSMMCCSPHPASCGC